MILPSSGLEEAAPPTLLGFLIKVVRGAWILILPGRQGLARVQADNNDCAVMTAVYCAIIVGSIISCIASRQSDGLFNDKVLLHLFCFVSSLWAVVNVCYLYYGNPPMVASKIFSSLAISLALLMCIYGSFNRLAKRKKQ